MQYAARQTGRLRTDESKLLQSYHRFLKLSVLTMPQWVATASRRLSGSQTRSAARLSNTVTRPVLLVATVPPARRARRLRVVSCSMPQRVDHGPFMEGRVAGWKKK